MLKTGKTYSKFCLVLLAVIILAGMAGCEKITATEIVNNVMNSHAMTKTYSFDARMSAITTVVGGEQTETKVSSENCTRTVDIENRRMESDIYQDGQPMTGWKSYIKTYLQNEWVYIFRDILDYVDTDHEVWVKLDLKDEELNRNDRLWKDRDDLGQQIELLSTAGEVTLKGSKKIDGVEAYLLEIEPDWEVLEEWIASQPPWKAPRLFKLPDMVRSFKYLMWISKDDHRILKISIEMEYELEPYDGLESTVELKGEILFSGYNEPFEMEIPEEALDAFEGPIS